MKREGFKIFWVLVLSSALSILTTQAKAEVYYEDQGQGSYTVTAVPTPPVLLAPADGQSQVELKPSFKLYSQDADGDSLKYKIQIDTVNTFNSPNLQTFDQTVSGVGWDNGTAPYASGAVATYTLQENLNFSTQYFWRVYAIDPGGTNTWSSSSQIYSFTTRPAINTYYEEQAQANYSVLSTPPNPPSNPSQEGFGVVIDWGGMTYDTTPTFRFIQSEPENEPVRYRIQIDDNSNFSSPVIDYTSDYLPQGEASFTVSQDLGEGTYYWRVMSEDITGLTSGWKDLEAGEPLSLVIDATPPAYYQDQAKASYNVSYAPATKFLVLAPEEVLREGGPDGKISNIIMDQLVGRATEISIYAVSDNFIIDRGYNKTVNLSSSDQGAEFTNLAGDVITSVNLVNGEAKVKVKFSKPGGHTITVTGPSP